jgi:hypothetical protein
VCFAALHCCLFSGILFNAEAMIYFSDEHFQQSFRSLFILVE